MKVLVCGGRNFIDFPKLTLALERFEDSYGQITWLIHGDARGADRLAGWWATARGIWVTRYPAEWDRYRGLAGPIRNQRMLDEGKPDYVIAFKGGNGTAHMKDIARRAGVPVIEID